MNNALCRVGVFYDGGHFAKAQSYFFAKDQKWLHPTPFHDLIEHFIRKQEQNFTTHKVVYAAWYQGLYPSSRANEKQLRKDRNRHTDLMHAGVEVQFVPISHSSDKEKGVDVALAVDAMEVGLDGKIDVAVLVTGDGDFVPLVRRLMKHGIRVAGFYFEYEHFHNNNNYRAFANKRLLEACNYSLNINQLENEKDCRGLFQSLFRQPKQPNIHRP